MRSVIIGGGKIGYYLYKTLKERGRRVTIVEKDRATCERIADELDGNVIWGDGTNLDVLKDAGIEDAEIVAAVTGTDEENLVICQIAKLSFGTSKTIARVNNPKNTTMFKNLGIDNTVCSTEVITSLIEYALNEEDYRILNTFGMGSMVLAELAIKEGIVWCDKMIKDLKLPEECVFVSVLRGDDVIYPRGDTQLQSHDKVLIVTNYTVMSQIVDELYEGGKGKWKTKKMKLSA